MLGWLIFSKSKLLCCQTYEWKNDMDSCTYVILDARRELVMCIRPHCVLKVMVKQKRYGWNWSTTKFMHWMMDVPFQKKDRTRRVIFSNSVLSRTKLASLRKLKYLFEQMSIFSHYFRQKLSLMPRINIHIFRMQALQKQGSGHDIVRGPWHVVTKPTLQSANSPFKNIIIILSRWLKIILSNKIW